MQSASRIDRDAASPALIYALFLLSGVGGLVYEVIWIRRLTLIFGSGLFATSTILATFMGGLAFGSWWLGRKVDRVKRPLAMFGGLEIGIGLYAIALPLILAAVLPVYQGVYRTWEGNWTAINATRLVLCGAVFLFPTFLMGGTLPALSRFLAREGSSLGTTVGRLYGINTLGAVAGCLLAGFVLIEWLGLRGAELVTAAVNLLVGSVAWIVGRRSEMPLPVEVRTEGKTASESAPMTSERLVVLLAYSMSGFAALGYEVAWARLLTFFLGDSTYAFATMLGTFLFGLAAGAFVMARFTERFADPFRTFATIQLFLGLSMAVGLFFYPASPYLYGTLANLIPGSTWLEWLLLRFVVGFAVLLVPTLLMGASFPLAGRLYFSGTRRLGSDVGVLYAGNTVGAILGSLAVGFAVIPALGVRNSIVALIGLNAAIATVVGFRGRSGKTALALGSAALVVAAILVIPTDVFLIAVQRTFPQEQIVYYREFPSATVFVTRSEEDERWVHFSDKRASGGTMNLPGHRFWGHLPALLAEKRRSALVITFGSGLTTGAVATHPFEEIVCAEICEGIREPAKFFPENGGVLDDPRVHLVSDDGRNVVLGTGKRFDVIVAEPPLLETAGVVNLYTREFYVLVKERLSQGGVFCQWIPSFEFAREEHAMIIRTFQDVFPEAQFWGSPLYGDTLLIGGLGDVPLDVAEMTRRLGEPKVRQDLEECGVANLAEFLGYFAMGPDGLRDYCGEGPILTDDRTYLDFRMPRLRRQSTPYFPVAFWKRRFVVPPHVLEMQSAESVLPHLSFEDQRLGVLRDRIDKVESAKRLLIEGHIAGVYGRVLQQGELYERALALAPDYTNARYYTALHTIEQAEQAVASGDRTEAQGLARRATPLAADFEHLRKRLSSLP